MDYEKKYNEALERARIGLHDCNLLDCDNMTRRVAITTIYHLFPELIEDEDNRIRKAIIALIEFGLEDKSAVAPGHNVIKEEAIAWLEKQSKKKSADEVLKIRQELYQSGYNDGYKHGQEDMANKEYVFRPMAGTMIENAVEQALKQGDVVLAFNGFYTPVKGKTSDEILAEYNNWIDKQSIMCKLKQIGRKYCELLNDFINK